MSNDLRAFPRPDRRPAVPAFDPHFAPSKSFDDALFGDMRQQVSPRRPIGMPRADLNRKRQGAEIPPR